MYVILFDTEELMIEINAILVKCLLVFIVFKNAILFTVKFKNVFL